MRIRSSLVVVSTLVAAACAWSWALAADGDRDDAKPEAIRQFNDEIVPLLARIKNPVLYEGLPHQTLEKEQLANELRTKKTRKLHSYDFYDPPKPLTIEGDQQLLAAFTAKTTYKPYGGGRMCTFHPDWCLEWKEGKVTYCVLFCFHCEDAMLFVPAKKLMADLSEQGREVLAARVKAYRKQRPAENLGNGMF